MTTPLQEPGGGYIVFLEPPREMTTDDFYRVNGPGPAVDDEGEYITAAAVPEDEQHTGAMIALIPTNEDALRLAMSLGESIDQLHLTMMYLGEAADIDDETRESLRTLLTDVAQRQRVVEAEVFSLNLFNPTGDEPCLVLGVSGRELDALHNVITDLCNEAGADISESKLPWVPHITIAYVEPPIEAMYVESLVGQRMGDVTFDRLRLALGDEVYDFELQANTG